MTKAPIHLPMQTEARERHWEQVYNTKSHFEVSWYQPEPTLSHCLIEKTGLPTTAALLDIGSGTSTLVDQLLLRGYDNLAVLDTSAHALSLVRKRLGTNTTKVQWHHGDITTYSFSRPVDLWHDRATFHFLVDPSDRQAYLSRLNETLALQGHLILATFAVGGSNKCSGLDVVQYDAEKISATLGEAFRLVETINETHRTPTGAEQLFAYFWFIRNT
ncbi:MAG: class I SAM-dependent methyltransferase [Arenicellales bacterium]|nr:class I SAM-dependent methyltransferase [Arenicellales bacterium]